jgi:hypothetical protein
MTDDKSQVTNCKKRWVNVWFALSLLKLIYHFAPPTIRGRLTMGLPDCAAALPPIYLVIDIPAVRWVLAATQPQLRPINDSWRVDVRPGQGQLGVSISPYRVNMPSRNCRKVAGSDTLKRAWVGPMPTLMVSKRGLLSSNMLSSVRSSPAQRATS